MLITMLITMLIIKLNNNVNNKINTYAYNDNIPKRMTILMYYNSNLFIL